MICDSTVSAFQFDETEYACEVTEEDKKYMKEAIECAKKSPDPQTKVGAVVVKGGKVVGRGWNRMPLGCETRFSWQRDKDKPIEEGKHYYVVYGIRAAIIDGYKSGADLRGATLYTTLYPSNVCAQCIRDAEIAEVVFISDKFYKTKFVEAAKRILEGIKCRLYNVQD